MITTCLWFQTDLESALALYQRLFPDYRLHTLTRMGPDGPVGLAEWQMHGTQFRAINQPADFRFNEAISLSVTTEDQAETDRLWFGLIADGGEESRCGWLKDPFGVSWQIVPKRLNELFSDPNPARVAAAQQAMLAQSRIVIAELEAAANQAG